MYNDFQYGVNYSTRSFSEIFPSYNDFAIFQAECKIPLTISLTSLETLYYLLYAHYGNSHIASSDENRFKYELFSIIFARGPAWQTRVELQKKIMELTDDELLYGAQAIYDAAFNPETQPTASEDGGPARLNYINQQNVTHYKKSKADAYALKMEIVRSDVTTSFILNFKKLFTKWGSELPLYYKTYGGEY